MGSGVTKTRDKRLKIPLNRSAPMVVALRTQLNKIFGKELSWDEFFEKLAAYIDLPAENTILTDVRTRLKDLENHLRVNREESAADIVEVFTDALVDVLKGNMTRAALEMAICNAGD